MGMQSDVPRWDCRTYVSGCGCGCVFFCVRMWFLFLEGLEVLMWYYQIKFAMLLNSAECLSFYWAHMTTILLSLDNLQNSLYIQHRSKYHKYIRQKWTVLFAHTDWLSRRWLAKYYSPPSSRRKRKWLPISNKVTLIQVKLLFGPLVIQLVWYILKQLFTSMSVKVVDIYLHFGE